MLNGVLPLKRLYESPALVAFHHPRPAYPVHILLVPKQVLPNLNSLEAADADLLYEIVVAARQIAHMLDIDRDGYRLILNSGKFQEFPQLHIHLVADQSPPPTQP